MFTTTAGQRARRSVSIGPSRGSRPAGSSRSSAMTCAETRSAVREERWVTPTACSSRARRSCSAAPVRLEVVARAEVQEVLPRALGAALAQRLQLLAQVLGAGRLHPVEDLLLARARVAGEQVDDRVRVGRDEVHRAVLERLLGERAAHRHPPAARHAGVAHGAAAEHPHAQVQPALGDLRRRSANSSPHASREMAPVVRVAAEELGQLHRVRRRVVGEVGLAQQQRAACSTRSGRRRASGSGRRGPTRTRAARPSCRGRRCTSGAAAPGPPGAPSCRAGRSPGARRPPPPGPSR